MPSGGKHRNRLPANERMLEDTVFPVGFVGVAQAVPRHMHLFEQTLGTNGHLNLGRYFFSDFAPCS